MDFHGLKRKELRQLCKKHGIPANLKNVEMEDRLSALFKEEQPMKRGRSCLKDLSVINDEEITDSKDAKRVKFSPQNETFVFEKTDPREMRLLARKRRGFRKSKDEDTCNSINGETVQNVDIVEEEKLVVKNLRRRSIVVKSDQISDSGIVDNGVKPVARILSRKSAVVKSDQMPESKSVQDVLLSPCVEKKAKMSRKNQETVEEANRPPDKMVTRRQLRSTEVVAKVSGNVDENIGVSEKGKLANFRKGSDQMPESKSVQDVLLSPCVEKKAKMSRKNQETVEEANRPPDKMVTRRQLRSTEVVAKVSGNVDENIGVSEKGKLAKRQEKSFKARGRAKEHKDDPVLEQVVEATVREMSVETVPKNKKAKNGRKTPTISKMQEVKRGREAAVEDSGEGNTGDNKIIESEGLKRRSLRKTKINVGPKAMRVLRRSSRQEGMSTVEQQVVDDYDRWSGVERLSKVHQSMNDMDFDDHEVAVQCVNEQEAIGCSTETPVTVHDKGTIITVGSAPPQSLSDYKGCIVDEECPDYSKVDNSEEATEVSPRSTEKMDVMNNTLPLEDSIEESEIINKTRENAPAAVQSPINDNSMFQNSGDGEAEITVIADRIEESSPSLNIVADKNSYEETAPTPSNIVKSQLCDTPLGSIEDQKSVGESVCHSTMKLSMPGSSAASAVDEQQPSSCLDEFKGEVRNSETLVSSEKLDCYGPSRNEQSIQQESWCEPSPCLSTLPEMDIIGEDKLINYDAVTVEESDVQSAVEGEAAGLWVSCDSIFREVEQTTDALSVDQQSSPFISQENVVLGPETSVEANVQSSICTEGLTPSSNASAATLNKFIEEDKQINTVTLPWNRGIDSSSTDAEDFHVVQSLNKDDDETRTEPSSTFSSFSLYLQSQVNGSTEKGQQSCKETSDVAYVESTIQVNNSVEEGKCKNDKQLDEVNVKLEVKGDVNNFIEGEELPSEKKDSVSKQDAFCLSIGGETPVLSKERKWSQVSICPGLFGSIDNKTFECASGSNKAKYLEQCSMDAVEALKGDLVSSKNNSSNSVNFEDRELPKASNSENELACFDVGGTCTVFSDHNLAVDTLADTDKLEFHLNDDNKSADWKSIPQKDVHQQLENFCDNYIAQTSELTVLSGSVTERSHKETPHNDLTCVVNDGGVETVDENDKCLTVVQQEKGNCFNEPEFQHLVSRNEKDDSTNDAQSKDLESERVTWTTEDLLTLSGEVEKSVLFQERKLADLAYEDSTLRYNVHCGRTIFDPTKDLDCMPVKDDDGNVPVQDVEPAEASNLENATSNGELKSSSNKVSENNLIEETVVPANELPSHLKDDETSVNEHIDSCSVPMEAMEKQTPKVSHAEDSSPFTSQEKTNIRFEIDNFTAQLYSVEKEVGTMAQETGYTQERGVGIWGNVSPESTIRFDLDEATGQVFTQQRSVERATGEGADSAEKDNCKSNRKREHGEAVERGLARQSSLLAVSEKGKNDGEIETVEVCSAVAIDSGCSVGQGKDSGNCNPFEMTAICGSPMRNSGNFSLTDGASVFNNDAEIIVVSCPPCMDQKSPCYSATFEIASDSLHTSQDSKNNETLQNACTDDIEGVHPGKTILLKNDQDNEGDMIKPDAEKSDVLPSESVIPDNIKSQALICEIDDGPESIAGNNLVESADTKKMELQVISGDVVKPEAEKSDVLPSESATPDNIKSQASICEMDDGRENITGNNLVESAGTKEMEFQGDMVKPDAEKSDALPSESAISDNIKSQASICEMDDGPESIAGNNLVESAGITEMELQGLTSSPFSDVNWKLDCAKGNYEVDKDTAEARSYIDSATMKCGFFGEYEKGVSDIEKASESVPEVQSDNELNAANSNEEQEEDASTFGNDDSASRRFEDLSPFDFDEDLDVNAIVANKKSNDTEAEVEFNVDEGKCIFGEQVVDQEHTDGNMDPIDKDACMTEDDQLALKRPENLESSPCENYLMDSAAEHTVHSESRSRDDKDNATYIGRASNSPICENNGVTFDSLEEKVTDGSVGDIDALSKSMEEHDEVAAEPFFKPSATIGRERNDSDSVDNIIGQLQELNHTTLMPSYQQMDHTEFACQTDNAEDEGMMSDFVFTDSEIELFWAEATKDELQIVAADVTGYVNVNEIANVDGTHKAVVEKILEPDDSASGEQKQLGDDKKEERGVTDVQDCIDDRGNENHSGSSYANNSGRVAEKSEDLDADDKALMSSVIQRKNARSVLIHGTPKRLPGFVHDMKENTPAPKRLQTVDATAIKPSLRRRKALEDLGK